MNNKLDLRIDEIRSSVKQGQNGSFTAYSIRMGDQWYHSTAKAFQYAKQGQTMPGETWDREYNGKTYHQFKPYSQNDLIMGKLDEILTILKTSFVKQAFGQDAPTASKQLPSEQQDQHPCETDVPASAYDDDPGF